MYVTEIRTIFFRMFHLHLKWTESTTLLVNVHPPNNPYERFCCDIFCFCFCPTPSLSPTCGHVSVVSSVVQGVFEISTLLKS